MSAWVFVTGEVVVCTLLFAGMVLIGTPWRDVLPTVRSGPFLAWLVLCVVVLGAFFAYSVSITGPPS